MNSKPSAPRVDSRFSAIEVAIIVLIVLVGGAVWQLNRTKPQLSSSLRESQALRSTFKEYRELLGNGKENPERARRESELLWQEARILQREYQSIAGRIEEELPHLRNGANEMPKNNPERQRNLQEMKTWLAEQKARASFQTPAFKHEEVNRQMLKAQTTETNSDGFISAELDLKGLLANVEQTFNRYIEDLRAATENVGKPLVGAKVTERQEDARQAVAQLAEAARQARQEALNIEGLLETQTRQELVEGTRRQQELKEALMKSQSPEEFARRIQSVSDTVNSFAAVDGSLRAVERVRYLLLAAVITLISLLLVELYRRAVVTPLRRKLLEREGTIEEHQKLTHFEELAAGLAHEIRNPLTTISARLYTIQRKLREGTPEHKDAEVIGSEIQRVNHILKEFIQVTRPAPPKLELMDAARLIGEVRELMAPLLQQRAVKLEAQPGAKPRFYGDEQQLKQVLVNLVQNAAESLERNQHEGAVVLRAREDKVPLNGTPTRVAVIEVEDNGPGIRPEIQQRLFEPFFSTKKSGTGLGLPISARIIHHHGGTLDFKTQAGRGTVFRILLPAYEQE